MKFQPEFKAVLRIAWCLTRNLLLITVMTGLLAGSIELAGGLSSRVKKITRPYAFDFGTWTLDAVEDKFSTWALSLEKFIQKENQSELVLNYLAQVQEVRRLNSEVLLIYANPDIPNPKVASLSLRLERDQAQARLDELEPLAESILQAQLMAVVNESGLEILGQVLPPSLYRTSDIPYSLIVSPRTEISQVVDVSLQPGIQTEVMEQIETNVYTQLDHAALVVPIGGIGTYPTMVMQSTNIVWLTEVISHEWTHNFLTLRPLGINYYTSEELRTINETVASLAGKELGRLILAKYYPAYLPPEVDESETPPAVIQPEPDIPVFDFRLEMRETRLEVDRLLALGEVDAAEAYMEQRRQFFWQNGYLIRKLNQAYFAFYGAYNDEPGGGAAGEDPVGPAVVAYRAKFNSLADFLNAISWVDSYEDLLKRL